MNLGVRVDYRKQHRGKYKTRQFSVIFHYLASRSVYSSHAVRAESEREQSKEQQRGEISNDGTELGKNPKNMTVKHIDDDESEEQ